ncbi:MAG: peptidylprolyl isomerase [Candidatus Woesearchaeota archaeon]|nr:peptidylprolyl isomerase [Candidatus Woesearchaeota archaeon]
MVVLETSFGDIHIELDEINAPITTQNFLLYVNEGFYDGTIFHRVIGNFMIQGGGFLPDTTQKETKSPIVLESYNGLKNNIGTIAMARTNVPNSATSQFFINVENNSQLNFESPQNPGYAVFGKVILGMDVVNQIRNVETTTKAQQANWPQEDVIIKRAYQLN